MKLLPLLIKQLESIDDFNIQGGVAATVWKDYFCSHGLQLMQHWEEGLSPSKTAKIQSQAASELCTALYNLLVVSFLFKTTVFIYLIFFI